MYAHNSSTSLPFLRTWFEAGLAALSTCLLLLWATPGYATEGFGSSSTDVSMRDLKPRMSSAESYSERYTFKSDLDDGGYVEARFTISNLGMYDGHGKVEVKVKWPDEPNYSFSHKYDSDEWSYDEEGFGLNMGKTSVEGTDDQTFVVEHTGQYKGKELDLEFTLESDADMWTPGQISSGDSYYRVHFLGLQSNASGTVSHGDSSEEIEGTDGGYAEHTRTNVAPFNLADRIASGRKYAEDPKVFFVWRQLQLTSDYGGNAEGFLIVGYNNQIVFATSEPDISYGKHKKDPKGGYKIPQAVQIDGEKGEDSVKLVLRADEMDRSYLLENYGRLAQMAASAMTNPYHYYMTGTYGLQMNIEGVEAGVRGDAGYVIDVFNE